MLNKIQIRPGIVRDITPYANEGGWIDCDKVRFRNGYPETIGGWSKYFGETFAGVCRAIHIWVSLAGTLYLGVGTHLKYYVNVGDMYSDITPIRLTTAAGDATFAATNGSSTITVTETAHGTSINSFVTFSGAATLGGNITADVLNQEYQIASIVNDNSYTIIAKDTAGVEVTANGSDTGNGGASTVATYQVNVGLESSVAASGWGAGSWGEDGWGEGSETDNLLKLRVWSHDNFGEDLLINASGGGIYYWDEDVGVGTRAVALSSLPGANLAPTVANWVLVSDQDRHAIAFGADPEDDIGVQDPLLVRWCDQENIAEWQTLTTNTAGSQRLGSGSEIIMALQTKREILIFTDSSLFSMQFLGPPYTFGFTEISKSIQVAGPNSAIAVDDRVFWMGRGRFMVYDGQTRELRCTIKDYVFDNINPTQYRKVFAGHNARYSEVWWFYPEDTENDRYVIYNYLEDVWSYGSMARTAWRDTGLIGQPLAADASGVIFAHEEGLNDGSENPPVGINAYIESAPQDLGDGNNFFFINRVIPDVTFVNSTGMPTLTLTLKARRFMGANYHKSDDTSVTRSATSPVEKYTEQVFVRLRGRAFAIRFESNGEDTGWRVGTPLVDIRQDGRK